MLGLYRGRGWRLEVRGWRLALERAPGGGDGVFERRHRPVELLFVHRLEDLADARAGSEADLQEMPAEENRAGRAMLDAELTGAVEKPVHRRAVEVSGLAAEAVGLRDAGEEL